MFRRRNFRRRRPRFGRRSRKSGGFRRVFRKVPRLIPLGVPKSRYAKLSYCDTLASSVTSASYVSWAYQSSLYDPYVTLGGHQPMYFDQYSAMYQRYTVMGIAYSISLSTDQNTNGPLFVTMTPSSVGTSPTSISVARERTGTKETNFSHGYRGFLKGYISCAKVLGVTSQKLMSDDQYSALVSASPLLPAYLTVQVWNQTAGNITAYASLRLTFYCRFYDPTEPSQS